MAAKRKDIKVAKGTEIAVEHETVVIFKATKPLTQSDYEALSKRLKFENEASGVKIVLAPCIVDGVEIKGG